jgi:mutator protein MutT
MDKHPAHHYKYCPRCAAKGFFDSNTYAFTCKMCGFVFYLNASAAVAALIVNTQGELLLVRRGVDPDKGKLDLPGGFVDPGESAEQAVVREIHEELDIVPDKIEYIGSFPNQYNYAGTIVFTLDMAFICVVGDFSTLKCRDDVAAYEFVLPENIDYNQIAFQSIRQIINMYKNGKLNNSET